ncbi:hypothetical protein IVB69_05695 [Flavobacterium sp. J49]|uniref:hypothetical protein n=1 Tax=Flavobacterium sp. J49 TaxID=2718534 RepID=UPI001594CA8E|nr:hypothetical protein [Flavobacterium sp. J49]MBF6640965.1 hypothetical protein [Flavobacterium sp. J49]NIC02212.1 hypothetical protein [Flavobacterium sp. J49]
MSAKIKYIAGITTLLIVLVIGFIMYGLNLIAIEDKYGDLVTVREKVEDGDLILKSNDEFDDKQEMDFQEFGIIEKSWGKVYVWDNKNTLRKPLFDWAEKENAQKVKVLRVKNKIDYGKIQKVNGKYNYLLKSDEFELVTESL